jgi:hypothetical protein
MVPAVTSRSEADQFQRCIDSIWGMESQARCLMGSFLQLLPNRTVPKRITSSRFPFCMSSETTQIVFVPRYRRANVVPSACCWKVDADVGIGIR